MHFSVCNILAMAMQRVSDPSHEMRTLYCDGSNTDDDPVTLPVAYRNTHVLFCILVIEIFGAGSLFKYLLLYFTLLVIEIFWVWYFKTNRSLI